MAKKGPTLNIHLGGEQWKGDPADHIGSTSAAPQVGGKRALLLALEALPSRNKEIKGRAAEIVANQRGEDAIDLMLNVVLDRWDVPVRNRMYLALTALHKEGEPVLQKCFERFETPPGQRKALWAREAVFKIVGVDAIPLLGAIISGEYIQDKAKEDPKYLKKSIQTNLRINAIKTLHKILLPMNYYERRALQELNPIYANLTLLLNDKNQDVVFEAMELLAEVDYLPSIVPAFKAAERILKRKNARYTFDDEKCLKYLGQYAGGNEGDLAVGFMNSKNEIIRKVGILLIGEYGMTTMVPELIKIIEDKRLGYYQRTDAIKALGKIQDIEALFPLFKLAYDIDEIPALSEEAVYAIGEIKEPSSYERLATVLDFAVTRRYHDSFIRTVLVAIGKVRGTSAINSAIYDLETPFSEHIRAILRTIDPSDYSE
jgi:hypothetical protein